MNDVRDQAPAPDDAPHSASELASIRRLLRAKEQAWLRLQKEAQARDQCRQL
ncbi:hypothetical protein [Rhizobium sp. HT1-10]|uniref:hypothetical protein n=1 Tax=Rhizobium sp. HT1-10 TaxID=3111638 RepID=UPI003C15EE6E